MVFIYHIGMIFPYHWFVCRDYNYVKTIYFTEFDFLGKRCTRHAGQLFIHTEIVLEGNSCKRFIFFLNLNMLLCLNCLMKTV